MLVRYVLVKLAGEHATADGRAALAAELEAAFAERPGGARLGVAVPADDETLGKWDLAIELGFDDLLSLERFLAEPRLAGVLEDLLEPRAEVIKAWSFRRR